MGTRRCSHESAASPTLPSRLVYMFGVGRMWVFSIKIGGPENGWFHSHFGPHKSLFAADLADSLVKQVVFGCIRQGIRLQAIGVKRPPFAPANPAGSDFLAYETMLSLPGKTSFRLAMHSGGTRSGHSATLRKFASSSLAGLREQCHLSRWCSRLFCPEQV